MSGDVIAAVRLRERLQIRKQVLGTCRDSQTTNLKP